MSFQPDDRPSDSQVMSQVQAEMQLAYLQEFITVTTQTSLQSLTCYTESNKSSDSFRVMACCAAQTVRDKCFEKCVTKPSSSLDHSCLSRCADRYGEVCPIISRVDVLQKVATAGCMRSVLSDDMPCAALASYSVFLFCPGNASGNEDNTRGRSVTMKPTVYACLQVHVALSLSKQMG